MATSCSNTAYWLIHLFLQISMLPFPYTNFSFVLRPHFGLLIVPVFCPQNSTSFKYCPFAIYLSIWGQYMNVYHLLFQNFPRDAVAISVPFFPSVTFIFIFQDPREGSSTSLLPLDLFSHCTFKLYIGIYALSCPFY